jgi:cob(I)alamin adenosyltransferase
MLCKLRVQGVGNASITPRNLRVYPLHNKSRTCPTPVISAVNNSVFRVLLLQRAERQAQPILRGGTVDAEVGVYLNRLSDYLFVLARAAAPSDVRGARPI